MSKYIAEISLASIDRMAIIPGSGRPMSQLKGDADFIMNAGFYDTDTGKPVGHLKVQGNVLAKEKDGYWAYCWSKGPELAMLQVPGSGQAAANYITGVQLLTPWDSIGAKLSYPAAVGSARPRTAMAVAEDKLILYCADSPTTPERLREELYTLGARTALMLDGGGSSQCDFGDGRRISSTRRVHNYIAVWLKKPEKEDKPMNKKVVLDPGHGVETAGKRSPDGKYLEHEFNLDMAQRLKAQLERHGVSVTLTRSTEHDVTLEDRVSVSNAIKPDLFVSLHSNASGEGWTDPSGYGIYTSSADDTAGRNKAAKAILKQAADSGVEIWGSGLHHSRLYVLVNTVSPAVLIEHGFHTNINEVELLKTDVYRDFLAMVDAKGILDYLGIAWVPEPAESRGNAFICPHCGGKLKIEKG